MHLPLLVIASIFIGVASTASIRFPDKTTDPDRLLHFQKAYNLLTGTGEINIERRVAFEQFKSLMEAKQTRQEENRQNHHRHSPNVEAPK